MNTKIDKTILIITDGIGYNTSDFYNSFNAAKKPTYDYLFKNVPHSLIKTSGLAVGLPEGQMGNSEVGHMCIGSGQILYQNLVKISMSIENDSLKSNEALNNLFKAHQTIHIIGLVSDGGVHSHINHIIALAKLSKQNGKKVFLHVITDGRDVSPTSALKFVEDLEKICDNDIQIATICGRFFALDRDNRWERVEKAYRVIVEAQNKITIKPTDYIKSMYKKDITDEFIEPISLQGFDGIQKDDGIIFANFRNDRAREIVKAISSENFSEFKRERIIKNIVTMTEYDKTFRFPILFPATNPEITLSKEIAKAGISQFHTAETEKYAHVTFFFNGGVETPVVNETRVLIPSPKVKTYDEKPQMSAKEVGDAVLQAMEEEYGFIVVNFANGDMVGHTGSFEAARKAVEAVDNELGRIIKKAEDKDYKFIITSDHGNCEAMKNKSGEPLTNHTTFDVFCFIGAKEVKEVKTGGLSNIAATVLKLMGLPKPEVMNEALF
ncbi:MAG: 2,3-bisphosphoglycerate-independent phosphoglycerate mutase [Campylobacteraceae bacterium]